MKFSLYYSWGHNMYMLIKLGGSMMDDVAPKYYKTKEAAQEDGKLWKESFSPNARKYYNVRYRVKEVK